MRIGKFFTEYFKCLPVLLLASSAVILVPGFLFIVMALIFSFNEVEHILPAVLGFWLFGHLLASPGLLLVYLPIVVFLKEYQKNFFYFVSSSTLCAFINGFILSLFLNKGEIVLITFFLVVGFFTGALCHLFLIIIEMKKAHKEYKKTIGTY